MKLKPEELHTNRYILFDEMSHVDLMPFVKKYINKRTGFSAVYYLSIFVFFGFLLFFCIKFNRTGSISIKNMFAHISFGVLGLYLLIPIHELIHALAYKLMGAKHTSFDMNLKKFYFLAIADKFVASKQEFQFVALAPFLLISITLLIVFFLTGDAYKIILLTTLTIHSASCVGDFSLLSYFEYHKKKDIITYDDKANRVSFFYEKRK